MIVLLIFCILFRFSFEFCFVFIKCVTLCGAWVNIILNTKRLAVCCAFAHCTCKTPKTALNAAKFKPVVINFDFSVNRPKNIILVETPEMCYHFHPISCLLQDLWSSGEAESKPNLTKEENTFLIRAMVEHLPLYQYNLVMVRKTLL